MPVYFFFADVPHRCAVLPFCDRVISVDRSQYLPTHNRKIFIPYGSLPCDLVSHVRTPVGSKNSNLPIFNDLQGDEETAPRPLARLSLFDELETNAGDPLRFG